MNKQSNMTISNVITGVRIVLSFVWLAYASQVLSVEAHDWDSFSFTICVSLVFFVLLALSDWIDGFLARKRSEITTLGVYLDPIADKILVMCALLLLMQWNYIPLFCVAIILAREFLVSAARLMAASHSLVVPASLLGKIKTASTLVAIVLYLASAVGFSEKASAALWLFATLVFIVAFVFTIVSGISYFASITKALHDE